MTGRDILLIFRISVRVSARRLVITVFLFCVDKYCYLGDMSQPCCMKAPSANQRLLRMLKSLATVLCADAAVPTPEW